MNNVGRKFSNYVRTGMLSLLMCASSCTQKEAPNIARKVSNPVEQKADSVGKLLSMLERGDFHSIYISKKTKKDIISVNEISKYVPNDSVGELFYQVYVGNADKAIRKANNKKGKLVTVGNGITGKGYIELAGNRKAYEGDYISAHSVDSLTKRAIDTRQDIIKKNVTSKTYETLKEYEKDAVLSYLYNVGEKLMKDKVDGKKSMFEYLANHEKSKTQAQFRVFSSSPNAQTGLAKRNLIQMIIFGNGKIYNHPDAQKNFKKQLSIIKRHENSENLVNEIIDVVEKYGVDAKKFKRTKEQMQK